MIQLREYQQSGVDQIRAAYSAGFRRPLFVSPCGSGKTTIFSFIAQNAQAKGNRVLILAHRAELLRQISETLSRFGVGHGFIAAGRRPESWHKTQVGSVQSVLRRITPSYAPDLIVVDEAHHCLAETYKKIISAFPAARVLGVTATPVRTSGSGLGEMFDTLIRGPEILELIEDGFLCKPIYYAPPNGLDLSNVHTVAGDFNRGELESAIDRPKITGNAVEHYTRLCAGKPAIAFCTSIKHAEHVTTEFQSAGYRAEIIDGKLDDAIRARRVAGLLSGEVQIIVSVDVVSEGFDAPGVTAAILLRPTASLALYIQQVGRALRPSPGKTNAIILDHCGNCLRHGLAEEAREWSLDSRRRTRSASKNISVKQCPACFRVCSPAPACPACGHIFEIKSRIVDQVDGTLTELTATQIANRDARREIGMAKDRASLEAIARRRGYKPYWVNFILNSRENSRRRKYA